MKKLLIILFLLPLALAAQKVNGVYTRAEVTAQRPLQCSACLVQEGDSVWLFVRNNASTAVAGPDVIVTTHGNIKLHKAKLAGAINFANANYYSKAELNPLLNAKTGIGSITNNYVPIYDQTNKSIVASMLYQTAGKVGVGTTLPITALDVNGVITTKGLNSVGALDVAGNAFFHPVSGSAGWMFGATSGELSYTTLGLYGYQAAKYRSLTHNFGVAYANDCLTINAGGAVGIGIKDFLSYKLHVAGTLGVHNSAYFAINSGSVGIRRTTPAYALDIAGSLRADSSAYFATVSGNVGIGTATPTFKLESSGSFAARAGINSFRDGSNSIQAQYYMANVANDRAYNWQLNADGSAATFWGFGGSTWANLMAINADGRVGIGTTSPATSAILDVTSTTGAVLFPRMTSTQRDALTATNGMVIYNTTTNKLQVRAAGAWVDLH